MSEKAEDQEFDKPIPVDAGGVGEDDIEIVDDTPPEDRNRKPAKEPVEEVTDDELESYDEKVQKRIKKLSRGYHDERRAKETADRERQAAFDFAQRAYEENKALRKQLEEGSKVYIDKSLSEAATSLEAAKRDYKEAYDNGDAEKIVAAQEKMVQATMSLEQAKRLKPLTSEPEQSYSPPQQPYVPAPSSRAQAWQEENPWFGKDMEMSSLALAYHEKIVRDGVDPNSDRYYDMINSRMREVFPQYFNTGRDNDREDRSPTRAQQNMVVAPVTRGHAPKKVTLTRSQAESARRLGIPLTEFAKRIAKMQREEEGGWHEIA